MAIICPQCSEIHFEQPNAPPPTHCRKCESDLHGVAGLVPLHAADESARPTKPRTKEGLRLAMIGVGVIAAAGGLGWWGWDRYQTAKTATAVVVRADASAGGVKGGKVRDNATAVYKVGGSTYYQYPGIRKEGDKFEVYYQPGDPAAASEERPWLFLGAAGVLLKLGVLTLGRGLFRFTVARAREADRERTMNAV